MQSSRSWLVDGYQTQASSARLPWIVDLGPSGRVAGDVQFFFARAESSVQERPGEGCEGEDVMCVVHRASLSKEAGVSLPAPALLHCCQS